MSTHLPPPDGPTCGQWICYRQSVWTQVQASNAQQEEMTYRWPHLRQHEVNAPAHHIVAPSLVVVTVRLRRQSRNARLEAIPLLVGTCAALLRDVAQLDDGLCLGLRVADRDARRVLYPAVEVRDPGVIAQDGARRVELPEGDLFVTDVSTRILAIGRVWCMRGAW